MYLEKMHAVSLGVLHASTWDQTRAQWLKASAVPTELISQNNSNLQTINITEPLL